MNKYLEDTQYAAKGIIDLYMHEICAYKKAKQGFIEGAEKIRKWVKEPSGSQLSAQLSDLDQNTKQIREGFKTMSQLEAIFKHRQFAFNTLCGALLQIAKQGISIQYGKEWKACFQKSRVIGKENLCNIIWEGRNHALHFEDAKPWKGVEQLFDSLEATFGDRFSLSTQPSTNLSAHIIDILEWHSYEAYEKDMTILLGI